jgi:hypothetical protein
VRLAGGASVLRLERLRGELALQRVAALDLEVGGARGAAERARVRAALRRARGDVVGALLQARRHLDVDQEALAGVRGDVHRRPADQRSAGAAPHHAHADDGLGGAAGLVGDQTGQVAGAGARRQRAQRRDADAGRLRGRCQTEHRQRGH